MKKLQLGVTVLFALALTACGHPSSDSVKQQMTQKIIETGETEEWVAYKALLTGDFSGIENMDDRMHLEYMYENSIAEGDGRCIWRYILMDFNDDGINELFVQYFPDPYNNPEFESDDFYRMGYEGALVSYQDGNPILLWSDTLDANYYDLPLKNGKILDVAASGPVFSKSICRLGTEFEYIYEKQYTFVTVDYDEYGNSCYDGWLDNYGVSEEGGYYFYQDYYEDGQMCGGIIRLSEEEWKQMEDMIDGLLIANSEWKSCSVFTPNPNRTPITSVG